MVCALHEFCKQCKRPCESVIYLAYVAARVASLIDAEVIFACIFAYIIAYCKCSMAMSGLSNTICIPQSFLLDGFKHASLHDRGYRGRVVSATDTDVRMELEAQYKTVTVKKEQLKDAAGMAGPVGYAGAAAARPSWGGGRTPMHPGATPLHPSATPLHPSATPLHPSATPMHPGM